MGQSVISFFRNKEQTYDISVHTHILLSSFKGKIDWSSLTTRVPPPSIHENDGNGQILAFQHFSLSNQISIPDLVSR